MADFWEDLDKPYRFFSQFCNSDDWHLILKAVAGAVTQFANNTESQISLLDVGCGTGVAIETVCEQIFSKTRCFPSLSVVEPSQIARLRLKEHILSGTNNGCGPLMHSVEEAERLPIELRTDAILFIHSTYYIDGFHDALAHLVKTHLRPTGAVIALVLPERSPFFMGLPILPNCSNTVESTFKQLQLKTRSIVLKSRFTLPKGGEFGEHELNTLKSFWMPNFGSISDFRSRLSDYAHDGQIDFQDHLIIGKRKT